MFTLIAFLIAAFDWMLHPSVYAIPVKQDVGQIQLGEIGNASFLIKNRGWRPITIIPDQTPNIGVFMDETPFILQAGSSKSVEVAWRVRDGIAVGNLELNYTVNTSDRNRPTIALAVIMQVVGKRNTDRQNEL